MNKGEQRPITGSGGFYAAKRISNVTLHKNGTGVVHVGTRTVVAETGIPVSFAKTALCGKSGGAPLVTTQREVTCKRCSKLISGDETRG